mmetsp:Transcript_133824/g.317175  ORF Transcript_133824/g.317175 Transcript_133824/m.317175 type:complete len:290 (+) Transcript_133824:328-1197(+)
MEDPAQGPRVSVVGVDVAGGALQHLLAQWHHHRKAAPSRQLANCRGVVRRPRRSDLPPQGAVPQVIGAQRARRVGVSRGVRWPVVVHRVHHAIGTQGGAAIGPAAIVAWRLPNLPAVQAQAIHSAGQVLEDKRLLVREQGQEVPHRHVRGIGPQNLASTGVQSPNFLVCAIFHWSWIPVVRSGENHPGVSHAKAVVLAHRLGHLRMPKFLACAHLQRSNASQGVSGIDRSLVDGRSIHEVRRQRNVLPLQVPILVEFSEPIRGRQVDIELMVNRRAIGQGVKPSSRMVP